MNNVINDLLPADEHIASPDQELLKNKTILVVEDDQYISRVYSKWLQKYGMRVLTANNGGIALDILKMEPIDLVLLDLGMPGLNGIETLKHIRSHSHTDKLKVMILSNTTMEENRPGFTEIAEAGVDEILRKYEVSLNDLIAAIIRCFKK